MKKRRRGEEEERGGEVGERGQEESREGGGCLERCEPENIIMICVARCRGGGGVACNPTGRTSR